MTTLRAAVVLLIVALTTAAALPPATDSPPIAKTSASFGPSNQALTPSSWSAQLSDQELGVWSRFLLHLDWSLTEARPGDTVAFTLPAELTALDSSFLVAGRDGTTIARAAVSTGHDHTGARADVVTFTHTVGARDGAQTTLSAQVAVTWNREVVTPGGEVDLHVATAGQTHRLQATIAPDETDTSRARLYGYWQDPGAEPAAGPLQWRFVTPIGPIATTELHLAAAAGHRIDCADVRFRALTAFNASGDATQGHELPVDTLTSRCDEQQVTLDLPPVPTGTALMVLVSGSPAGAGLEFELTGQARIDDRPVTLSSRIERVLSSGTGTAAGSGTGVGATAPAGAIVSSSAPAGTIASSAAATSASGWATGVLTSWWLVLLLSVGLCLGWLFVRSRRQHRTRAA